MPQCSCVPGACGNARLWLLWTWIAFSSCCIFCFLKT
jgi:hypothetical protein